MTGCVFNLFVFLLLKPCKKNGILFLNFFTENAVTKLFHYIHVILIVDSLTLTRFYNMTLGIKNESVFTPPKICFKKASLMLYFFLFYLYIECGFFLTLSASLVRFMVYIIFSIIGITKNNSPPNPFVFSNCSDVWYTTWEVSLTF